MENLKREEKPLDFFVKARKSFFEEKKWKTCNTERKKTSCEKKKKRSERKFCRTALCNFNTTWQFQLLFVRDCGATWKVCDCRRRKPVIVITKLFAERTYTTLCVLGYAPAWNTKTKREAEFYGEFSTMRKCAFWPWRWQERMPRLTFACFVI